MYSTREKFQLTSVRSTADQTPFDHSSDYAIREKSILLFMSLLMVHISLIFRSVYRGVSSATSQSRNTLQDRIPVLVDENILHI